MMVNSINVNVAEIPTFLIFPYFMESHVIAAMPSLWMMDYQVRHYFSVKLGF